MREMRTLRHRSVRHVVQLPPDVWAVLDLCSQSGRLTGKEGLKQLQDRFEWETITSCLRRTAKSWPEKIKLAKEAKQAALDARPDWIKARDKAEAEASNLLDLEMGFHLGLDDLFTPELDRLCPVKSVQADYLKRARAIDEARQDRELNELLEQSASFGFESTTVPVEILATQIKQLEALF